MMWNLLIIMLSLQDKTIYPGEYKCFPLFPDKSFISLQLCWPVQTRNNTLNFPKQKPYLLSLQVEGAERESA